MQKQINFVIVILSLFIIFHSVLKVRQYFFWHPIAIVHPCPNLTKQFPILDKIDNALMLTAVFVWVEDKKYMKNPKSNWKIKVKDYVENYLRRGR